MSSGTSRGNNPERWEKFLTSLDEKLQLGLLEPLRRVSSYHFEEDVLYLEPSTKDDEKYLTRDATFQQLQLLAQDSIRVDKVKIRPKE